MTRDHELLAAAVSEYIGDQNGSVSDATIVDDITRSLQNVDRETVAQCVSLLRTSDGGVADTEMAGGSTIDAGAAGDSARNVMTVGDATGETLGALPVLEDVGHDQVPEVLEDAYHERETMAGKTDVEIVTRALAEGMNVLLKGPPGVGKSFLAKYVCSRTNRPLYRITLSETTYREDLLGHLQLVSAPSGESVTSWVDGPLTRAARVGGVLLLDEINAADANTAAALNAVMEQRSSRSLTVAQTGETIEPHHEFRVIATANPGYQGTYELNDAFEGRFKHVSLDYLEPAVEVTLVLERGGLDRSYEDAVRCLVEFANRLRTAYEDGELSTPITTRELVRVAAFMRDDFMRLEEATRNELLPRVDSHDEALVDTLITRCL
ncbi:AAA family ATPase [Natribaculum luteum]|uniref:AAA family ATPase n=1 Tax=Natribaculum luteum TaxID=1586232 RepID=A0ABD5P337_9EURY|nr:MoxR family ATPase [Natribaculum luteum]